MWPSGHLRVSDAPGPAFRGLCGSSRSSPRVGFHAETRVPAGVEKGQIGRRVRVRCRGLPRGRNAGARGCAACPAGVLRSLRVSLGACRLPTSRLRSVRARLSRCAARAWSAWCVTCVWLCGCLRAPLGSESMTGGCPKRALWGEGTLWGESAPPVPALRLSNDCTKSSGTLQAPARPPTERSGVGDTRSKGPKREVQGA
jgi:hypothetical protein